MKKDVVTSLTIYDALAPEMRLFEFTCFWSMNLGVKMQFYEKEHSVFSELSASLFFQQYFLDSVSKHFWRLLNKI